jgi:hypothetical protein
MTISLSDDLEHFILAEVHSSHFASEANAIAEVVRPLRRPLGSDTNTTAAKAAIADPFLSLAGLLAQSPEPA